MKSNPTPSDIKPHPIENSLLLQTHPVAHLIRFTTTSTAHPIPLPSQNPSIGHRRTHLCSPPNLHLCKPPNPIAQPSKPEPISANHRTPSHNPSPSLQTRTHLYQVFTNPSKSQDMKRTRKGTTEASSSRPNRQRPTTSTRRQRAAPQDLFEDTTEVEDVVSTYDSNVDTEVEDVAATQDSNVKVYAEPTEPSRVSPIDTKKDFKQIITE
ncbi:hypothetical protein L3X38_015881 [Prunus dulcis]|uniref:Uncharacterized protein n=1 Tax=Prunus dulcis TaxID=3755 RepID=A0AAD4W5A1_PRUDU|nr:hypothetical protein L3X38_015881 [Prunus dulcis]